MSTSKDGGPSNSGTTAALPSFARPTTASKNTISSAAATTNVSTTSRTMRKPVTIATLPLSSARPSRTALSDAERRATLGLPGPSSSSTTGAPMKRSRPVSTIIGNSTPKKNTSTISSTPGRRTTLATISSAASSLSVNNLPSKTDRPIVGSRQLGVQPEKAEADPPQQDGTTQGTETIPNMEFASNGIGRIGSLTTQLEDSGQKNQLLQAEVDRLNDELEKQKTTALQDTNHLGSTIDDLRKEITSLTNDRVERTTSSSKEIADLQSRLKRLQKEMDDLGVANSDLVKERDEAMKSAKDLNTAREDMEKRFSEVEESKSTLVDNFESEKNQLLAELSRLGKEKESAALSHDQAETLLLEKKQLNEELVQAKESIEELSKKHEELSKEHEDYETHLKSLHDEKSTMQASNQDLENQVQQMGETHKKQLEELKSHHEQKLNDQQEKTGILHNEIDRANARLEDDAKRHESLVQGMTSDHEAKINALKVEQSQSQKNLEQERDSKHQDELASRNRELDSMRKETEGLRLQVEESENEIRSARLNMQKQMESGVVEHEQKIAELKQSNLQNLDQQLESLRATHKAEVQSIQASKDSTVSNHAADLEALQTQNDLLKGQLDAIVKSHQEDVQKTAESHAVELDHAKNGLSDKHVAAVASLAKGHQSTVDKLVNQHETTLNDLEEKHDKAVSELAIQVTNGNKRIAELEAQMKSLEQTHADNTTSAQNTVESKIASLVSYYEDQLRSLQEQLSVSESRINKPSSNDDDTASETITGANSTSDAYEEQLAHKTDLIRELSSRIATLEIELSDVKDDATRKEIIYNSRPLRDNINSGHEALSDPFVVVPRDVMTNAADEEVDENGRTVEGTLASIQEQVRQLEELNDQIGVESARWSNNNNNNNNNTNNIINNDNIDDNNNNNNNSNSGNENESHNSNNSKDSGKGMISSGNNGSRRTSMVLSSPIKS